MSKRSRGFCLTVYKDAIAFPNSVYSIVGKEICPTTGRPHLQCYVYYKNAKTLRSMNKLYPGIHVEPANGTPVQNRNYCMKDKEFVETGELPKQGTRSDLESVYDMAAEGKTDVEIGEEHKASYIRYYKAIDRIRFNYARLNNQYERVEVLVLIGAAGSGKTSKAFQIDPNLYMLDLSSDIVWFDGYAGQKTILLDDFYGNIKYGYLLKLLDGYKFQLPIKGGYTWKNWKTVIITSNKFPEEWYSQGLTPALKRRLTSVQDQDYLTQE